MNRNNTAEWMPIPYVKRQTTTVNYPYTAHNEKFLMKMFVNLQMIIVQAPMGLSVHTHGMYTAAPGAPLNLTGRSKIR
jgi:hypothetical protein